MRVESIIYFEIVTTLAFLLAIDEIMGMGSTMVNVVGNCLASVVAAKWEGEFQSNSREKFLF